MSRFIRSFQLVDYDEATDPVLQEVASVGSQASTATICCEGWQGEEARGEQTAIEQEGGGKSRKVEGASNGASKTEGCLLKVRDAAASACVAIQLAGAKKVPEKFNIGSEGVASSVLPRALADARQVALVGAPRVDVEMLKSAQKRS